MYMHRFSAIQMYEIYEGCISVTVMNRVMVTCFFVWWSVFVAFSMTPSGGRTGGRNGGWVDVGG